jgi:hypothetical protein
MPVIAVAAAAVFVAGSLRAEDNQSLAFDFKLDTAHRLLHGMTLYPTSGPDAGSYPYPPLWAMIAAPFTAISGAAAQYAAAIFCLAAILGALWIIGIRDPYCYALAMFCKPVIFAAQLGNATAVILLLTAITYRHGAKASGVAVAIKPYAWPMLVWSATQRGWRDLRDGLLVGAAALLIPWAVIRFDGITRYPNVVNGITDTWHGASLALPAAVGIPLTIVALACMWLRRADPVGSFAFATSAMLAATPILWELYLVAILLPIALRSPRVTPLWLVPIMLWWVHGTAQLVVAFAILAWCGIAQPRPIADPAPAESLQRLG